MNSSSGASQRKIDLKSIIQDILKRWVSVLLAACAAATAAFIISNETYTPSYCTSATFVITDKRTTGSLITNIQTTTELTGVLSNIFDSEEMNEKICQELGVKKMPGRISAENIPETNFLTLSVYSSTPQMSYLLFEKVNEIYPSFTDTIIANAVITVFEPAVVPETPVSGNQSLFAAVLGFIAGIIICAAIIALYSYMNTTIKSRNDVKEFLSAPLYAEIPEEKNVRGAKNHNMSLLSLLRSFGYREAYKSLRTKIETQQYRHEYKAFLVAGASESEGKTTVAANLAITLSQNRHKVLLIDCDLTRPSVTAILEADNALDMTDYLKGAKPFGEILNQYRDTTLYFAAPAQPLEADDDSSVFSALGDLVSQAREEFDYIIVDTPPITLKAYSAEIAQLCDAAMLVVRTNHSKAEVINTAIKILNRTGIKMLGCVLNFSDGASLRRSQKSKYGYSGFGAVNYEGGADR